jgi:hypothetical protein
MVVFLISTLENPYRALGFLSTLFRMFPFGGVKKMLNFAPDKRTKYNYQLSIVNYQFSINRRNEYEKDFYTRTDDRNDYFGKCTKFHLSK